MPTYFQKKRSSLAARNTIDLVMTAKPIAGHSIQASLGGIRKSNRSR
jgi:hypothetical protein